MRFRALCGQPVVPERIKKIAMTTGPETPFASSDRRLTQESRQLHQHAQNSQLSYVSQRSKSFAKSCLTQELEENPTKLIERCDVLHCKLESRTAS